MATKAEEFMAQAPTPEQMETTKQYDDSNILLSLLEQCRLRADEQFDEPEYTLIKDGIGFAPLGNVMAIMAEAKQGKTWVMTQFASAMLKGNYMGLNGAIEKPKILFFDTEQDKADGQQIQRRVQYANDWAFTDDTHDEFRIFHLREVEFEQRKKLIDFAVRYMKPTAVFIDGIRDLLLDFNNLEESFNIIQWLMKLSSECHCAIWTVLHVNPNSDKMRGHLGTEMHNKTTDVFKVSKERHGDEVIFTVEHVMARHRDVNSWKFRIVDTGRVSVPELISNDEAETINDDRKKELFTTIKKYIPENASWSMSRLRDELKKGEHIGSTKAWNMILEAKNSGVLMFNFDRYSLNPEFIKKMKEDDPFC